MTLPLALRVRRIDQNNVQNLNFPVLKTEDLTSRHILDRYCADVPDHDSRLWSEGDVIRATVPFFSNVLEVLTPAVLRSHGYDGSSRSPFHVDKILMGATQGPLIGDLNELRGKRSISPSIISLVTAMLLLISHCVMLYNVQNVQEVLARSMCDDSQLNGSGPNAIRPDELMMAAVVDPAEARRRLPHIPTNTPQVPPESLLEDSHITNNTRNLIKQGVNYGRSTHYVIFYDYSTVLLLHVPQGDNSDNLIDVYICREEQRHKSTRGRPERGRPTRRKNGHIEVALKWILRAVQDHEGELPGPSQGPPPGGSGPPSLRKGLRMPGRKNQGSSGAGPSSSPGGQGSASSAGQSGRVLRSASGQGPPSYGGQASSSSGGQGAASSAAQGPSSFADQGPSSSADQGPSSASGGQASGSSRGRGSSGKGSKKSSGLSLRPKKK
ncbi:MAG: hypothetical protein Q9159_000190 [Coniocarpon cinnabarinum]